MCVCVCGLRDSAGLGVREAAISKCFRQEEKADKFILQSASHRLRAEPRDNDED